EIDAPPERVWHVMVTRTKEWWCPKPWTTPVVDGDLRAGGSSRTVMRGPEGEEFAAEGIFLEVVENKRLVFTDAYRVGWMPSTEPFMTGMFELDRTAEGRTRYVGRARHWTHEAHEKHTAMGFRPGWGAVADQLSAIVTAGTE